MFEKDKKDNPTEHCQMVLTWKELSQKHILDGLGIYLAAKEYDCQKSR